MGNTPSAAARAPPSTHAPITTPAGLPLPPTLHAVLDSERSAERIIIVGDIHGCLTELNSLLTQLSFDPAADTLISLGDAVNKGPDSEGVVRALMAAGALLVRGNHDEAACAAAVAARREGQCPPPTAPHAWATSPAAASAVAFLAAAPFSLFIPSRSLLVVHAGLVPGVALDSQSLEDLIELRHVSPAPDGRWISVPKKAAQKGAGAPWATVYDGTLPGLGSASAPVHVVFGHHASRRLQVEAHATGIDTGCVNGDRLSALVLPALREGGVGGKKKKGYEGLGASLMAVPAGLAYTSEAAE